MNRITYRSASDNFSTTIVENIFINKFMPSADGDYVKVYLYGLKNSQNPTSNPLSAQDLARLFRIDEAKVKQAYLYWSEKGIIEIQGVSDDLTIIFLDISEKFSQDYEVKTNPNVFPAQYKNDLRYRNLITKAEEMLGGQILPINFIKSVNTWIDQYSFNYECVCYLLEYCLTTMDLDNYNTINGKMNYINKVADNWYSNGVQSIQDAIYYTNEYVAHNKLLYTVLRELGLKRAPLRYERDLMEKWTKEFNFDSAMIMEGVKRTTVPNLNYLDKILTNWNIKNYRTVSDIQNETKQFKTKNRNISLNNEFPVNQEKIEAAKEIESNFFKTFKRKNALK